MNGEKRMLNEVAYRLQPQQVAPKNSANFTDSKVHHCTFVSEMTYCVSSGTLNPTHSLTSTAPFEPSLKRLISWNLRAVLQCLGLCLFDTEVRLAPKQLGPPL